jgi:hypothetical protein
MITPRRKSRKSSQSKGNIREVLKHDPRSCGIVKHSAVPHTKEITMRTMTRVLAATMFLLTAWTAMSLSVESAMAFPPSPCDWVDDFDGL